MLCSVSTVFTLVQAILITKTKTRTKMIAIRLLKLELKYSKKLKLYKNYIDSWLNELNVELSVCFNGHFPGEPGLAGVY